MKESATAGRNGQAAGLPRPRSFVIQLAADASPRDGALRGRAVHMTSGEASAFETTAELLGFLGASIERAEQDDEPSAPTGRQP